MNKIISGNLNEEYNQGKRGWFIGHFIEKESPFNNDNFEVKWAIHSKGETKINAASNIKAKTVSILISGKFALEFPSEKKEVVLENSGDFIYWDAKIVHTYLAIEDSTILTIRWPSLPNDQV